MECTSSSTLEKGLYELFVQSRKVQNKCVLPPEVKLEELDEKDAAPMYPTVIQQAYNNMRKFDNCVLLTKVGGFYELYLDQAAEYGPLLNIKVAQKLTTAGPVPMAGFPFFQLDRFLKILVQDLNKYVAISEEIPNHASGKVKSGGLLFNRKVTRIITPGTLVDEKFMDPNANNFLLAIYTKDRDQDAKVAEDVEDAEDAGDAEDPEASKATPLIDSSIVKLAHQPVGLAWIDLSTGEFYIEATTLGALSTAVTQVGPTEIVLSKAMSEAQQRRMVDLLQHDRLLVTWQPSFPENTAIENWSPMLESPVPEADQDIFSSEEIIASSMLLEYVKDKLLDSGIRLQPPVRKREAENMMIDKQSMRGLEVLETFREGIVGGRGSLLHALRRTTTSSGARMLRTQISSPSTSLKIINQRLDLVECFLKDAGLREGVSNFLSATCDSQRLVQKFSLGRGDADDLISLLRTINATNSVVRLLADAIRGEYEDTTESSENKSVLHSMVKRFSLDGPNALASRIAKAIDEEGLMASHRSEEMESAKMISMAQGVLQNEGAPDDIEAMPSVIRSKAPSKVSNESNGDAEADFWIMRRDASPTLERLHDSLVHLRQEKAGLTDELRSKTEASSLTLKWTPGLGHICHIRGTKDVRTSIQTLATARNVSSTKSTRSFYIPEWSSLGGRIDQAILRIKAEEQYLFQELREQVISILVKLRRNATVLDELDVACSSAALAEEQGFVRPSLNLSLSHKIIGGRHPTVKLGLEEQGRGFVSNNCFVGEEKHRIWLITGPNMAGKSTFLRQNALISILAQIGSFVPAEHAEIGIVDQIFSRIGSGDNLFLDQSTFMVEMLETATILKNATPRSFVIMDEVGRGTTPEDGLAVAYACLHHLYHVNGCRTLFATHFHKLADMTKGWGALGCYCTDVHEGKEGAFSYVHRLREGVNRESHALKVARLAGIPKGVVDIARGVLGDLRGRK
ncbi:MAG: DNA mismatch repair ATPase msh1 [Icmadophila ericetorum]|nr:DNA mismatch repair ATPase msh1 [Icmadophila ericetorum]